MDPSTKSAWRPATKRIAGRTGSARTAAIVLCCVTAVVAGCSSTEWVTLRETPRNPLSGSLDLLANGGPKPTERTLQIVRRYDLERQLRGDSAAVLAQLAEINHREPAREHVYALAELAYIGGRNAASEPTEALELFGSSVMYAHEYLFDDSYSEVTNPYDPQFRGACDLYNAALEEVLRLVHAQEPIRPGTTVDIKTVNRDCSLEIRLKSSGWHEEDIDQIEFVSDYQVEGLTNHYHRFGLGVPIIAMRKHHPQEDAREKYYPSRLAFPLTAFLTMDRSVTSRPGPSEAVQDRAGTVRAVLELHDPLTSSSLEIANRRVPLETDLSTPLAFFLSQPEFSDSKLANLGFLMPEKAQRLTGLYMLEPYHSGKMPVVMVHGLWSSPVTWMEMFNDLRNDPRIRDHYQFWFYLYPTGEPFWHSAAQFRSDLAELRSALDPSREAAALDQMVLVGHSMGGLVSKLQTVESGSDFWQTVSEQPFSELQADDALRRSLQTTYFFSPNPSVQRVVTIGTPHRGSHFSNSLTRWLSDFLIDVPGMLMRGRQQLVADNPRYFRKNSAIDVDTSIKSLAPESPFLTPLLAARKRPAVAYHNIIGQKRSGILGSISESFESEGDGIVSRTSATVEDAASQITVPADHVTVHRHPQSILEVRRILLEQITNVAEFGSATRPQLADGSRLPSAGDRAGRDITQAGARVIAPSQETPLTVPARLPSPAIPAATGYPTD